MANTVCSSKACYIKALPQIQQVSAARVAKQVFSPNALPLFHEQRAIAEEPAALALYTKKYWGPEPLILTVSFLENPTAELCNKILTFMNLWGCSITFKQAPAGTSGNVRISLEGQGYWSYLGTDILLVPQNQPTMNLEGFSMSTSDAEFHRVVCHETGHTLGFPHEQLRKEIVGRIDHSKAYAWFEAMYGWSKDLVDKNVLSPIGDSDIFGSTTDGLSIMAYHLPASIMIDGQEVPGGPYINSNDVTFCHTLYPPSTRPPRNIAHLNLPEEGLANTSHSSQLCYIKMLPQNLDTSAARVAREVFPMNAPTLFFGESANVDGPAELAMYTKKYWGPEPLTLTVSFLENPGADLSTKILRFMNAWGCSITFELAPASSAGNVRISLAGKGHWSYLGTDILSVPQNQPTMNLEGFSMTTPDDEYQRVVCHEAGHTLGFPHEHFRKEIVNRIDQAKAYAWCKEKYGWSKDLVDLNLLAPINDSDITGSATDDLSIMAYHLPASIMTDGKDVPGGTKINSNDMSFCHSVYPPSTKPSRRVGDLKLSNVSV